MTLALYQLMRKKAIQAFDIKWRRNNMRRLEIDGQPEKFDQFVGDISYGKGTYESEELPIGNGRINLPQIKTAGSVTVVFRDDEDGTISKFISSKQKKIWNDDGTQNLPIDYLFEIRIYRIKENAAEWLEAKWDVYVEENNEYRGDDSSTEQGTFSVVFKKHKSFGGADEAIL